MTTWFGDIGIPWIISRDTSISKETIEKNFARQPPYIFEKDPETESGSYTAILNKEAHEEDWDLNKQEDAVLSMAGRNPVELPFQVSNTRGHIYVTNSSVSRRLSSDDYTDISLDVKFYPDEFYPAFRLKSKEISRKGHTDYRSAVPISSAAGDVVDSSGDVLSPEFSIPSHTGDIDFYEYTDDVYTYERNDSEYHLDEYIGTVNVRDRRFDQERQMRSLLGISGSIENDIYRADITPPGGGDYHIETYFREDGGIWRHSGEIEYDNPGSLFILDYSNYSSTISSPDFDNVRDIRMFKGYPMVSLSAESEMSTSYYMEGATEVSSGDAPETQYVVMGHPERDFKLIAISGNPDIPIETSGDLSLEYDSSNATDSTNFEVFFGVLPDGVDSEKYADYVINISEWKRTLVKSDDFE